VAFDVMQLLVVIFDCCDLKHFNVMVIGMIGLN